MQATKMRIVDYDALNAEHKARFAALNREWLERYFRVEDHDEAAFADPHAAVLAGGGDIIFAQADEGGIVGTGSLVAMDEASYEIAKMAVTEGWQGRGIGERLLRELILRAQRKKARKLFIVSNTRLVRAINLYRRHDFVDSLENRHSHYERGNITLERGL